MGVQVLDTGLGICHCDPLGPTAADGSVSQPGLVQRESLPSTTPADHSTTYGPLCCLLLCGSTAVHSSRAVTLQILVELSGEIQTPLTPSLSTSLDVLKIDYA